MARGPISFELDKSDLARIDRNLKRASGKSLLGAMQVLLLTQGDIIARKAQRAAPRRTGNLRRSIWARPERVGGRFGGSSMTSVLVGPGRDRKHRGYHAHLVISGTGERPSVSPKKPSSQWRVLPGRAGAGETTRRGGILTGVNVRRAGSFTVGRMTPNPFMDRAKAGVEGELARKMAQVWGDLYQSGQLRGIGKSGLLNIKGNG